MNGMMGLVLGALAGSVVACGSDDSGGNGGKSPVVTITGTVNEFQVSPGTPKPLEGVQVCVMDSKGACATTDASGKFSLSAPANTESALLFTKSGYANVATVGKTDTSDGVTNAALPTETIAQLFSTTAGFVWPLNGNSIILAGTYEQITPDAGDGGLITVGAVGSTLALSPAPTAGPIYINAAGLPDPALTASTKAGWGGFGVTAPGEYTITVTNSAKACARGDLGWPASSDDSARSPAIPEYIVATIGFNCQ